MRNSDSNDDARAVLDTQVDDMSLLRQYVELGSEEAFNALVARHLSWVYATCRKGLRDRHMAEDAAQAVFIILARRAASLSPQTRLSGWLFNTARFVVKDAKKQEIRYRRRENVARELSERRMVPIREAVDGHTLAALDDGLATLTERDRLALQMHFYEGLSLVEMAETLGISKDGAKKRVARALTRLRSRLARNGKGAAAPAIAALALLLRARAAEAAPLGLEQSVVSAAIVPGMASSVAKWMAHRAMSTVAGASRRLLRALIAVEMTVAVGVISVWSLSGTGGRATQVTGTGGSPMIAHAPAKDSSTPHAPLLAAVPPVVIAERPEAPYRSAALDDEKRLEQESASPAQPAVAKAPEFKAAVDAGSGQTPVRLPSPGAGAAKVADATVAPAARRAVEVPAPLPQAVARVALQPTSNGGFGVARSSGGHAAIAPVASSAQPDSAPPARSSGERPKPTRPAPDGKPYELSPVAELPRDATHGDGKPRPTTFYEKFWHHRSGGPSGHGRVELAFGPDDAERFLGHVRRMFVEDGEGWPNYRRGDGKRRTDYARPAAVSGDGADDDLRLCPMVGGLDDLVAPMAFPLASQVEHAGPLSPPFPPGRAEGRIEDQSVVVGSAAAGGFSPHGDFRQVPEPGAATGLALLAISLLARRRDKGTD